MNDEQLKLALAEVIRRHPELADDSSPEALQELRLRVEEVAQELLIKEELQALRNSTMEDRPTEVDYSGGSVDPANLVTDAEVVEVDPESPTDTSGLRRGLFAVAGVVVLVAVALGVIAWAVRANESSRARASASNSAVQAFASFSAVASNAQAQVSSASAEAAAAAAAAASEAAASAASASAAASVASGVAEVQAEVRAGQAEIEGDMMLQLQHAVNCSKFGGYDPENPLWACRTP